jgi:hypothetical protein
MPDALSAEHDKLTKTNDSTAIKYSSVLQHNRPKATELLRRREMTRCANRDRCTAANSISI